MSVLVNGSPTDDFTVGKGLRQGDPLSPFLFLIVVEGLTGLMRRAVEIGRFKGYRVNDSIHFQILQFADDTILIGEGIQDNLWTLKILLRSFELVSGLKINFVKSKLYGINIESRLLEAGAAFLSCRSDVIPFKFLGVSVGANPRRRETWKPVVESMSKRLNLWKSRQLSLGGRITLINSVLSSIPLYYFSFYKAPVCVLKSLVSLQRNFLWGGGTEIKKVSWVSWDQICLPKDQGGLGVKNLEMFNRALLSKWLWRCLSESDVAWADLIRYRYGPLHSKILTDTSPLVNKNDSLWWRDLLSIGTVGGVDWFRSNVRSCVGNGCNIGFWKFIWCGPQSFANLYPELFLKEACPNALITERMIQSNGNTVWHWNWREELIDHEHQQLLELKNLLYGIFLQSDVEDRWKWLQSSDGLFSVKSCYHVFIKTRFIDSLDPNLLTAVQQLWLNDIPSKVNVFGWRLLLQRLPTKDALNHRGILIDPIDLPCTFCFTTKEDCNHLFFHCSFCSYIWRRVFNWLGHNPLNGIDGWEHFLRFGNMVKASKGKRVKHVIWLGTTWCIWKHRNEVLFKGVVPNASSLLGSIQIISWSWFYGRSGRHSSYSFANWCYDPLVCLQSIL
jgi:hypothetical protein